METTLLALCVAVIAGLIGGFTLAYVHLQPQIHTLQNDLTTLSNEFSSLNITVDGWGFVISNVYRNLINLNTTVEVLENRSVQLPPPDFDSGWLPSQQGEVTIQHNLNTTEVVVYVIGNYSDIGRISQIMYGETQYWYIESENELVFYNGDITMESWQMFRVMIWKIAEP